MSSEMREWKFGDHVEWQDSPGNWREAVIIGKREGHDCTEYEAILADGERVSWYAFRRFRALLARTEAGADLRGGNVRFDVRLKNVEAGADGVVAWGSYAKCSERGTPVWNVFVDRKHAEMWASGQWSDGSVYPLTRPQDASGDAEFSAAELESLAKCVLASVTPGGFHIPEGWNVLLDKLTAMQAKEAK